MIIIWISDRMAMIRHMVNENYKPSILSVIEKLKSH